MQSGSILNHREAKFLLQHGDNKIWLAEKNLFKSWTPGTPTSLRVNVEDYFPNGGPKIDLESPSGLLKEALDGAARLSSHPDFLSSPFVEQLKILALFEYVLIPWKRAGTTFESTGVTSFSEVLCAGVGVCRHNTPLMAAILSEAGLTVRIYHRWMTVEEIQRFKAEFGGHTWLEVDSPKGQTFVIDPSRGIVKTRDDVFQVKS